MKTAADPEVLRSLVRRIQALEAQTPRRWGTMTAHEMLCHLGDAAEMVLRGIFGTMTVADWQRWAWKHTDHHLRQFGV